MPITYYRVIRMVQRRAGITMTETKKRWIERLLILSITITVTANSPAKPQLSDKFVTLIDEAVDFLSPESTYLDLHQATASNAIP